MRRRRATEEQKRRVRERSRGLCEYCRSPEAIGTYTFCVEHVVPFSKGGETILDNLSLACQGCNSSKYDKTKATDPATGEEAPLRSAPPKLGGALRLGP